MNFYYRTRIHVDAPTSVYANMHGWLTRVHSQYFEVGACKSCDTPGVQSYVMAMGSEQIEMLKTIGGMVLCRRTNVLPLTVRQKVACE